VPRLSLQEVIGRIDEIPTLRQVATKLLEIIDNPNSKIEEVHRIVTQDPPLAAKILRLVNSAYMGLSTRVADVKQAIVLLGFNMVRTMALSISVFEAFSNTDSSAEEMRQQLWEHSIITSNLCQVIAEQDTRVDQQVAFALGLLHDMGKMILDAKMPQEWRQILHLMNTEQRSFQEAEQEILRTDHAQIGAWIAEKWNLKQELTTGIRLHHRPLAWRSDPLQGTLRLANLLSQIESIDDPSVILHHNELIQVARHLRIGTPRLLDLATICLHEREQAHIFFQTLSQ
jgi:putative nucleotidyltransferase with HDIG domain